MKSKLIIKISIFILVISLGFSESSFGQTRFENELRVRINSLSKPNPVMNETRKLYPNNVSQGIMVPSGWGGYGTYLFGFVGGAYPEVYTKNKLDMIAAAGLSFGDPEKFLNFAANINMGSLRRFTDFSANISASRSISGGVSSVTVGGIQLFASAASDAPQPTFFIAFSHAVQGIPSRTPGCSKISYTIGVGNGRFLTKSGDDIADGKGRYGTAVFAGISYEVLRNVNLNAEWSGMNLALSAGISPFKNPLSFGIGINDITGYSSNKLNMIFSIGYPLSLSRNKY